MHISLFTCSGYFVGACDCRVFLVRGRVDVRLTVVSMLRDLEGKANSDLRFGFAVVFADDCF